MVSEHAGERQELLKEEAAQREALWETEGRQGFEELVRLRFDGEEAVERLLLEQECEAAVQAIMEMGKTGSQVWDGVWVWGGGGGTGQIWNGKIWHNKSVPQLCHCI